jgi:hypothetical protein
MAANGKNEQSRLDTVGFSGSISVPLISIMKLLAWSQSLIPTRQFLVSP